MSSVELTVSVQDKRTANVQIDRGDPERCEIEHEPLYLETIEILDSLLHQGIITRRRELEVLGKHLYRMLFNKKVESLFEKALSSVPMGERLRIQLSFQKESAADLASLPWEYLYCPDTETRPGFFFSTDTELVLTRYMPLALSADRGNLAPDGNTLRILIADSEPKDDQLGPVLAGQVIEAIENLKATMEGQKDEKRTTIEIHRLDKPTVDKFLSELGKVKPHILHFIGHGRFDEKEKRGEIALLGPDENSVRWVEDKDFTQYFVQAQAKPHLVFLHLCEGAKVNLDANFAGLAPQLIRAGIPAVVAMQHPITNLAAIAFSQEFYNKLAEGKTIGQAVQSGRYMITTVDPKLCNIRAFGTPVLYMRGHDESIQKRAIKVDAGPDAGQRGSMPSMTPITQAPRPLTAPANPSAEAKPAPPSGDFFENASKPVVSKIFLQALMKLKKTNLEEAVKLSFKERLLTTREQLRDKSMDDCRNRLRNMWDEEQHEILKDIWFDMLEELP